MTTLESDPQLAVTTTVPNRRFNNLPRAIWKALRNNFLASVGTVIVVLFFVMAAVGPLLTTYRFDQLTGDVRKPPSLQHIFGTDNLSRDVFSRVVAGSRDIISLAGVGTAVAVILGTLIGLIVSYEGGWLEEIVMRLFDSILALPAGLLALLLLGAVGPSRESILGIIIVVYIPIVARVVRSVVLDIKTRSFVEAARLRGEGRVYILLREILPNVLPALVVEGSLRFSYAIFLVSTLGFLGVGVQPPAPDWGLMISQARLYAFTAPWMLIFPCAAVAILIVGINLMSDGLKQVLQSNLSSQ
jgi:peptide/nickel transport system permease protein